MIPVLSSHSLSLKTFIVTMSLLRPPCFFIHKQENKFEITLRKRNHMQNISLLKQGSDPEKIDWSFNFLGCIWAPLLQACWRAMTTGCPAWASPRTVWRSALVAGTPSSRYGTRRPPTHPTDTAHHVVISVTHTHKQTETQKKINF